MKLAFKPSVARKCADSICICSEQADLSVVKYIARARHRRADQDTNACPCMETIAQHFQDTESSHRLSRHFSLLGRAVSALSGNRKDHRSDQTEVRPALALGYYWNSTDEILERRNMGLHTKISGFSHGNAVTSCCALKGKDGRT